jgi:hypothetical protein
MAERAHREGCAMHSVKAREQLVHTYHRLSSIHAATVRERHKAHLRERQARRGFSPVHSLRSRRARR